MPLLSRIFWCIIYKKTRAKNCETDTNTRAHWWLSALQIHFNTIFWTSYLLLTNWSCFWSYNWLGFIRLGFLLVYLKENQKRFIKIVLKCQDFLAIAFLEFSARRYKEQPLLRGFVSVNCWFTWTISWCQVLECTINNIQSSKCIRYVAPWDWPLFIILRPWNTKSISKDQAWGIQNIVVHTPRKKITPTLEMIGKRENTSYYRSILCFTSSWHPRLRALAFRYYFSRRYLAAHHKMCLLVNY